jgi:hypothetical protein
MALASLPKGVSTLTLCTKSDEELARETETETTDSFGTVFKTEKATKSITEVPVDGGLGGWTCVIGSWFALFATFGWLNS